MKVITIRNVPDDLYRAISRLAKRNRRSIQQQVLTILDRVRILDNDPPVEKAKEIRKRLANRELGDSVEEIRQERNR
jgi:plasmid stability protein